MARWTENYEWAVETGTMMQPRPVPGDYIWWQCFDRITLSNGRVLVDADTATQEEYYIAVAMRNALTAPAQ